MRVHCCIGRKDIGAPVSESEEGDTRHTLAHSQDICDGAQIDAEKVAGCDSDHAEQECQPKHDDDESDWFGMIEPAIIELEVGKVARFLIGTIFLYEFAFVWGGMNQVALSEKSISLNRISMLELTYVQINAIVTVNCARYENWVVDGSAAPAELVAAGY